MAENIHCRVCGLDQGVPPWDERGVPTWDICYCCGAEFGYEDNDLESVRRYRQRWLDGGAKWFRPKEKPKNWDIDKQMSHIPQDFR